MQLRDMRYATIEGTEVAVQVASPTEAKAALKELRHKKKEVALLKRRLQGELKKSRAVADKAERAERALAKKKGFIAAVKRLSNALGDDDEADEVKRLERDIGRMEEIGHNLDSCIIQLEGKLLT